MEDPQVITYDPLFRQRFIDLNIEWLEKYFKVEPHDKNVFENIEELILDKEGEIFFCKYDNEIVGTAAMQIIGEGIYELSKMAVTGKYQGMGLGKLLISACIDFARQKKATKVILLSNRSLIPAISLYIRSGFKEVPLDPTDYSRANIQMELYLS